jgi:hypothetical protein
VSKVEQKSLRRRMAWIVAHGDRKRPQTLVLTRSNAALLF